LKRLFNISFHDVIGIVSVYSIIFFIIGFLKFLKSKFNLSPLIIRRIIHVSTGITILSLPLFSHWIYPFLLPLGMAILIGVGLATGRNSVRNLLVDDVHYSKLHSFGPIYYMMSAAILMPLTWDIRAVGMAAVMIMAWGDGSAALIAPQIKERHKYPWSDKSFEGSLLVLSFGFLGSLIAWIVGYLTDVTSLSMSRIVIVSFIGALVGCLTEAASIGVLKPFDNFTVPLLSALSMFLASQ
jgi:phytol kinase